MSLWGLGRTGFGRSPDVTDTAAFKRWFGNSVVVDKKGNPLLMYHGGPAGIKEFRPSKMGNLGPGIYFTPDENEAKAYARRTPGAEIYAAYIRAENPWIISHSGVSAAEFWDKFPAKTDEETVQLLLSRGYDAVWAKGYNKTSFGTSAPEIVVFDPRQIKSVNNRGTFDPNDPNILHGLRRSRGLW